MSYEAWGEPEDSPFDAAIEAGWLNPIDISRAMIDVIAREQPNETVNDMARLARAQDQGERDG